jgi:5-methyltetrahydropteroyltriglutamate--homocysteine methyltransferase
VTDRILTTHGGSLPRSAPLIELLVQAHEGRIADETRLREQVAEEMGTAIENQADAGIDIAGDGELARLGFDFYVKDRMSGYGGSANTRPIGDLARFPGYARLKQRTQTAAGQDVDQVETPSFYATPAAVDRVVYDAELAAVKDELALFDRALKASGCDSAFSGTFVTAVSPGTVALSLPRAEENPAYATDEEYLFALAGELKHEYEYIVDQGHELQVDAPDLAMERDITYQDRPVEEFLEIVELHIAALNMAVADIPPERIRLHVCWGNYDGPHVADVELHSILPLLYRAKVGALTLPCANPRHSHEHKTLAENPLPDGLKLVVGAIDVTTNYVEHPEVVADRLESFANSVGDPARIVATTDCGLSTFAGYQLVAEDVAWKKLEALAQGAELASERLFR